MSKFVIVKSNLQFLAVRAEHVMTIRSDSADSCYFDTVDGDWWKAKEPPESFLARVEEAIKDD